MFPSTPESDPSTNRPIFDSTLDSFAYKVLDWGNEWEVEKIPAARLHRKKLQYEAKWLVYDDNPTWYDTSRIHFRPHLIHDFPQRTPESPWAAKE